MFQAWSCHCFVSLVKKLCSAFPLSFCIGDHNNKLFAKPARCSGLQCTIPSSWLGRAVIHVFLVFIETNSRLLYNNYNTVIKITDIANKLLLTIDKQN